MINGLSVCDLGAFATTRLDFKAFFDRPSPTIIFCLSCSNHVQPKNAEGPFIIFYGRKSIFGKEFSVTYEVSPYTKW